MRIGTRRQWLRSTWQTLAGGARHKGNTGRRFGASPRLEELEGRLVPATPSVLSLTRTVPLGPATNTPSVTYTATFSEAVTGVDATDFQLALTGSVTATTPVVVAGSGAVYSVTVNGITGAGTLGLNLVNNGSIRNLAGNSLAQPGGPASFQEPPNLLTAGSYPEPVAAGDVNGDGKPDLVTGNHFGNNVGLFLGNGDGTFQPQQIVGASNGPTDVKLADVNGDGKLDLFANNGDNPNVNLWLGNGDGTFQPPLTVATDGDTSGVVVQDVNGDGKLDLLVNYIHSNPAYVGVLLGNGDGTFQAQRTYTVGLHTRSLAVADVNADGKPDLLVPNEGSNNVSVLLGNGDGTFQPQTTFATGEGPTFAAVADLNADGKPDLLITNGGGVSVLLGNGNGTFQNPTTYPTGAYPFWLAVGDVNGDSKLDVAVANLHGNSASVLVGNGDGTFQPQQAFVTGSDHPASVTLVDLNGDGKLDLVVADAGHNQLDVLLNTSTGSLTGQVYTISPTIRRVELQTDPCEPTKTALVVNGTTAADRIVFSPGAGGSIQVFFNGDSQGTFRPTGRLLVYGQAGNDFIQVANGISLPAWLFGGDGNDSLHGGAGNDVLSGGAGDDQLLGGQGMDLQIGGLGADDLNGNADGDLLIAGTTSFDNNLAALCAIMDEWTAPRDYATRLANLRGTGAGPRANGNYFLVADGPSRTVFDDGVADRVSGAAGQDWAFANIDSGVLDDVTGTEFVEDID